MSSWIAKLRGNSMAARVAPFFIFAALTTSQTLFGEAGRYWIYIAKSFVGAWLLWVVWPVVPEMRWKVSWEAVVVGLLVLVLWVGIDPFYPKYPKEPKPWNPNTLYGEGSALAWILVVGRILGSSIVVPPMEEMFYRSFVYRYIINPKFDEVPLNRFHPLSFVITSVVFGMVHREWLAGILCGLAYQWLVVRKGRLGDAMTAHAITNFGLGVWIVYKGAWHFW
ncbi:MAG: CAAX prenyl protease-related protein [Verrucomicrobiota bacterium]